MAARKKLSPDAAFALLVAEGKIKIPKGGFKFGTPRKKAAAKGTKFGSSTKDAPGRMPIKVIESHARRLGRNPRALAVYKRVLGL
jgi:hypothetical protein